MGCCVNSGRCSCKKLGLVPDRRVDMGFGLKREGSVVPLLGAYLDLLYGKEKVVTWTFSYEDAVAASSPVDFDSLESLRSALA